MIDEKNENNFCLDDDRFSNFVDVKRKRKKRKATKKKKKKLLKLKILRLLVVNANVRK